MTESPDAVAPCGVLAAGETAFGGSRNNALAGNKMHANTTPSHKNTSVRSFLCSQHEEGGQYFAQEKRAHAETHDDDPGHPSLAVGKPLGRGCNGRDIAKPDARATDDAIAEIEEREDVQVKGEAGDEVPARKHDAAGHGQFCAGQAAGASRLPTSPMCPKRKIAMLNAHAVSVNDQPSCLTRSV